MRYTTLTALCLTSIAFALAGCASTPATRSGASTEPRAVTAQWPDIARRAAQIAQQQIGVRYRYGGTSPANGFDCSGLVHYSYAQAGVTVPRTSHEQFRTARKIALAEARPGDIVFFQDQEKLSHVGIYLGQRRFVHAPASGRSVSVALIDSPYYQEHLVAVGRLISL